MSVTAVLESRVLNSRPVTLLYTYLPCPPHHHLLPFSPSLSATLPLSLLPSLSSRFPDRFIFSPRSFQYTYIYYIYVYTHIYIYTSREVRFFSKGARHSSNRTRQSVIIKREHESLVYSLAVKTKYLSVNSVFSFSSELNVAFSPDRSKRFQIFISTITSRYTRIVCVCSIHECGVFRKEQRKFCDKASMRCMPGSCLTRQLPGKLGPSRRVLDGFPTTFLFSRARLSFLLTCPVRGGRKDFTSALASSVPSLFRFRSSTN